VGEAKAVEGREVNKSVASHQALRKDDDGGVLGIARRICWRSRAHHRNGILNGGGGPAEGKDGVREKEDPQKHYTRLEAES